VFFINSTAGRFNSKITLTVSAHQCQLIPYISRQHIAFQSCVNCDKVISTDNAWSSAFFELQASQQTDEQTVVQTECSS